MTTRSKFSLLRAGLLACCAMVAVGVSAAQDTAPTPPPAGGQQGQGPGGGRGGMMMDPGRRADMMKTRLGLSDDQTAQVKAVYEGERTQMEALRADTSSSQEDRRSKMMAMRKDSETKIQAILTADQKTKYEEMQKEMRDRMRQGGGPPPQQ